MTRLRSGRSPRVRVRDEALLYDHGDSPFGLKVRICLQVKEVPFRRVAVSFGRRAEFRRLNPLGTVPVLVHDGEVVTDSRRIVRHLEVIRPEPALIPSGHEAHAYAVLLEEWADETLHSIVRALKWLNPENRGAALASAAADVAPGPLRPIVARWLVRAARRRYAARAGGATSLDGLTSRMRENLSVLAALVGGKPYLLGRAPTLADVAVLAQLEWMGRYAERRLLDDVPDVVAWRNRLAELPPVAAALSA